MASPKSWIGLWPCAVLVTVSGVALANSKGTRFAFRTHEVTHDFVQRACARY
jgi:hypothetical protein